MPAERMGGFMDEKLTPEQIRRGAVAAVAALNKNLPEGILSCVLEGGKSGVPYSIRVDSVDNRVLDPFVNSLKIELGKAGLKLDEHVPIGFTGDNEDDSEQADAWYVVEA